MKTPPAHLMRRLLPWMLAGMASAAQAGCGVAFSLPAVNLGERISGSLPDADLAGWQVLGTPRTGLLTVLCEPARAAVHLRFDNLVALGQQLLRWDAAQPAAALRLRVSRVTADGVPVALTAADGVRQPTVAITQDGTLIAVDLAAEHRLARSFVLEIEMTGFVERGFVPRTSTRFSLAPQVELIDP